MGHGFGWVPVQRRFDDWGLTEPCLHIAANEVVALAVVALDGLEEAHRARHRGLKKAVAFASVADVQLAAQASAASGAAGAHESTIHKRLAGVSVVLAVVAPVPVAVPFRFAGLYMPFVQIQAVIAAVPSARVLLVRLYGLLHHAPRAAVVVAAVVEGTKLRMRLDRV